MNARLGGALVCMATLLAAALATGSPFYYYIFLVILLLVLWGLASTLWTLLTLRVEIRGLKQRARRSESIATTFTVRHACPLPVQYVRISLNVPSAFSPVQEITVALPPFARRTFRHYIACPHRGVYQVGIQGVSVGDVCGLFVLRKRTDQSTIDIEVAPRCADHEALPAGVTDYGPEYRSRATEDAASPSDVRLWQEGDSLKKVHWKLSMRRRQVVVRTYEESARPDTLILPDLTHVTALKDMQLTIEDEICERCLAMAKAQLALGLPVRMPLTSSAPSEIGGHAPSDLGAFEDALMRVSFDSPYPYQQVLTLMLARLQRTGCAVLATSRLTMRVADIAMQMQRVGIRVMFIWVDDDMRDESLEILERMRMAGVRCEHIPISSAGLKQAQDEPDFEGTDDGRAA